MIKINSQIIKDLSKNLGIDLCGVTDYKISEDKINHLKKMKALELESPFQEKDLNLRIDPNHILEDYKSIIVIGMNYYNTPIKNILPHHGRLSISSYGEDYHKVLKDKLEELAREISRTGSFRYLSFVDTGSLIDRELAYLSGIGHYGKNCSIISSLGSFIFIGYMVTDLNLEIDKPSKKNCGDCEMCIKACPTGALNRDNCFNYKRCISYLTQSNEFIEGDLIEKIDDSIFGCDICQLVCPKNKNIKETENERLKAIYKSIDIYELASMTNREFKEKYGMISGSWRGKNILLRNGLINLYNNNDKGAFDLARQLSNSNSKFLRDFGVNFIKKYGCGDM